MRNSDSRIDADTRIDGEVQAHEDLTVDGHLVGSLVSTDTVTISDGAIVEGDIHVRRLVVHGIVVGSIAATDAVEIGAKAQVKGDIRTRALSLEAGGRIAGKVATGVEVEAVRSGRRRRVSSHGRSGAVRLAPAAETAATEVVETDEPSPASTSDGTKKKKKAESSEKA